MNRLGRIAIGALFGAVLTLLLHPLSSRYMLTPFLMVGRSATLADSEWIPRNLEVLPAPSDTLQASLWMQTGAEILAQGKSIDKKDLAKLVAVAEASSRGEPENAYWLQMDAVFLWELGRRDQARQRWERASLCNSWNDYQSRCLGKLRAELDDSLGGPMAWHAAAAYFQRSTAAARTIEWLCRGLFEKLVLGPEDELDLRLATIRNGRLMRDGSRFIPVGIYGTNLVDYSCAPFGPTRSSPRQQILSRYALVNALRSDSRPREAAEADDAFRTNDAWLALTQPTHALENARTQGSLATLFATLPGVLLGVGLMGLALLLTMRAFLRNPWLQRVFRPPWTPALGVLAGLALYLQTGLILAAAAVTLCFAFVAFEPSKARKHPPERMGVGFRAAVLALSGLFVLLLGGFWCGISAPALEVLSHIPVPLDLLGGNTILISLAALVFSMLFLAAPGWAVVDRVPTPFAVVVTLSEFGRRVFWIGLLGSLIAAPAAVYFDKQVRSSVDVLLANEPAHYLLQ